MEGNDTFIAALREALEQRQQHLESDELPAMKDHFRALKASFETVTSVLQRKHLLNEDPYKYEDRISEVDPPQDAPFDEYKTDEQLAIRLSRYDSILEFLANYYEFSVTFVDLRRLKSLLALVSFIQWDQFSPQSQSPTTRAIADVADRIRHGGDNLSTGLITDGLSQLAKATRSIKQTLRALGDYQKEAYKLRLREQVITRMSVSPEHVMLSRDEVVKEVRKRFASEMPSEPYASDLVIATLDEDYSPDSAVLHEAVLRKLAVRPKSASANRGSPPNRLLLLEAIRIAAAAARPLMDAVTKLNDNNAVTQDRRMTLRERFRRFLGRVAGVESNTREYEVEYFDEGTGAQHTETVDYSAFVERVTKKAKFYGTIANKMSAANQRLEQAQESQVYEFVTKDLSELHVIHRRLNSLDTYFKSEVSREERGRLRGIKIELTTVKNHLVKANQKRHEYVARQEETDQLRRLGIDVDR